ncbi:hypothetical protein EMCRGX_G018424 [Ephydatia muelleri]
MEAAKISSHNVQESLAAHIRLLRLQSSLVAILTSVDCARGCSPPEHASFSLVQQIVRTGDTASWNWSYLDFEPLGVLCLVTSARDKAVQTAVSLAREGLLSKACQVLTSSGLAPNNDTTWNLLISKHPKGIPPTPPTAPPLAAPCLPPDFDIMAILHSFPKDTACGPSGLRIQHLIEAAEVPLQFPIGAVLRDVVNLSLARAQHRPMTNARSHSQGTSAACPLAAGVIALALEANNNLTWRYVKYLLVYTSNTTRLSQSSREWFLNSGGLYFSHQFGFGAIDAEALVNRARSVVVTAGASQSISFTYQGPGVGYVEQVAARMTLKPQGLSLGSGRGDILVDCRTPVLLQTAKATLHHPDNPSLMLEARIILDSGSQRSYITNSLRMIYPYQWNGERL